MGITLSFLAAILSSTKDLISKRLSFDVHGTVSAFASFLFALPYYLILLAGLWVLGLEGFILTPGFFGLVILRSLSDLGAELMKMHAFGRAEISLVAPFFALAPLFLLIVSPLITGDVVSLQGVLGVILTAAGSFVLIGSLGRGVTGIEQRSHGERQGILLAVGAAFCFSLNNCFDRLAVAASSPVLAGFGMTLCSAVLLYLPSRRTGQSASLGRFAKAFSVRGLLEVTFMTIKLTALGYLQAPYVSAIGQLSILVSIIGGRVFFDEQEFWRRMLAGGMMLAGVMVIVLEAL